MKNQPLSFITILRHWEGKRLLFNLSWMICFLLVCLVEYLENDSFSGSLGNGFLVAIFFGLLIFANLIFCGSWIITYFAFLLHVKLAEKLLSYSFWSVVIPPFFVLLLCIA